MQAIAYVYEKESDVDCEQLGIKSCDYSPAYLGKPFSL